MSTASEGKTTDSASRTGSPPSALALLTATALGSVVASRLPKAPLVLAAGATALALLQSKKSASALVAPPVVSPPAEKPSALEPPPQDKVQQWLDQQIHRDTGAEIVELPFQETPPPPPEEVYSPPAFLLDDEDAVATPLRPDFARLTEPVPRKTAPPPIAIVQEPDLPALQALEATESCLSADAGWILGIDPLPSIGEVPAPPVFIAPVFEGGDLPDEIEMPQPPEPVVHLTPSPSAPPVEIEPPTATTPPPMEPEPVENPAQEIAVQIALPGEASFDPPLVQATHNPWQQPFETVGEPFGLVTPEVIEANSPSPVIEAEIVLRPRAPTQTSVVAKSRPLASRFSPDATSQESPPDETTRTDSAPKLPPAPQVNPREQNARPTWRSWWRGE